MRQKKNLYLGGKNDELYELCKKDAMAISETVRKIEKNVDDIDTRIEKNTNGIFLIVIKFAALRIALDKAAEVMTV